MIINHVIITFTWVHLWNGGANEIFLSGGRITYDPLMSCWEPLTIIIHRSRSTPTTEKAQSVRNLMGFAYFCLPEQEGSRGNSTWRKEVVRKTHRQVRVHRKKDVFLYKSVVIETRRHQSKSLLKIKDFYCYYYYYSCIWMATSQED